VDISIEYPGAEDPIEDQGKRMKFKLWVLW
jgi:hypothetical protein